MANFEITINEKSFFVSLDNIISTECSDTYIYNIYAEDGDDIDITLTGDHIEEKYILNDVETSFTDSTSIIFDTSLKIYFSIENSGASGVFDTVELNIINNTTSSLNNDITKSHTRYNDSEKCNI